MDEGWVERAGLRLHYLDWHGPEARREPGVILLHGLSSNARVWERAVRHLPGRRVVALDQRSHGASDRPARGHGPADLVADAAHAIRELDLGRPLVAGHSWGAAVAVELAAAHPELASGVAVVDGPAASLSRAMTWEEAARRMQPPLPHYRDLAEAVAEQRGFLGAAWDDDLWEFVRSGLVEVDGGLALTLTGPVRLEILQALYAFRPEDLLPRVRGPVLLAMAAEMFPGAPPEFGEWRRRSVEEARRHRPDLQVRWYASRHDVPLVRPAELAADLERTAIAAAWWSLADEAEALAGEPAGGWARPAHDEGGEWDASDLLAHLASTQASMAGVVAAQRPAAGGELFDADRWNAAQVRRRRGRSPAELAEEMGAGARAVQAALMAADLDGSVAIGPYAGAPLGEAMEAMLVHQRGHLAELRTALARA